MIGREDQKENDLFFLCSLIDYIGRKTKNYRSTVVNALGRKELQHIYDYADVYHCENIDKVSDELIEKHHIEEGYFDNISSARYSVPSHWDIGKVYQRLILDVANNTKGNVIDTLFIVYNSWITRKIDNYNSSMYYESPSYLFESIKQVPYLLDKLIESKMNNKEPDYVYILTNFSFLENWQRCSSFQMVNR